MTDLGIVQLSVLPDGRDFQAQLLKIATTGAQVAGREAGKSFSAEFLGSMRSGLGDLGPSLFAGADSQASAAGATSGKAFSASFTEAMAAGSGGETAGQLSLFGRDATAAGAASGKNFASGFDEAVRINGLGATDLSNAAAIGEAEAAGIASGRAYSRGVVAGTDEGTVSTGIARAFQGAEAAATGSGERAAKSFVGALTTGLGGVATAAALVLTVVGVESIKQATEFQKQLELVHTQAGASQAEVDSLRGSVLALGPATGQGPDKLAEALFHVESVGYRGKDALGVLKIGAEEASISGANLDDTVYALTSTMKTFGDTGVAGATKDIGLLNAIVGQGDLRFQDLNKAIGTGILSTSQTFGVSLQSTGAALDFLTDRGEKANVAATRLSMGIVLLASPSQKAAEYLGAIGLASADVTSAQAATSEALEKSGLTTTKLADDLRKPDGIFVALSDLKTHLTDAGVSADESDAIIARIFGGARTGKAIETLISNLDGVQQKYNNLGVAADDFGKDFAATQDTMSFKWHSFVAMLQVDSIKLGTFLMPFASAALGIFSNLGHYLAPISSGIADVWHQVGFLTTALTPLGHIVAEAFGAVIVGSIDAVGVALRDGVAPAVHLVADVFSEFDHNRTLVVGLGIAIGTVLAPALVAMAGGLAADAAASAAFVAVNIASSIEAATGAVIGFVAANPELAAAAVIFGGLAAAVSLFDQDTRTTKTDVDSLTDSIKKQVEGMGSGDLSQGILGDIANWKPTSGSIDGIAYLQKYGVNVQALSSELANPANKSAFADFQTSLGKTGILLVDSGTKFGGNANEMKVFQNALHSTNPEVQQFATLFSNLEKDPTVNGKTIKDLVSNFASLTNGVQLTRQKLLDLKAANDAAGKSMTPDGLRIQAAATGNLADITKVLAGDQKAIDDNTKNYNKSIDATSQTLLNQFPIFTKYRAQLHLNAQALLDNVNSEITAVTQEGQNVLKLTSEGASGQLIKTLTNLGPEYVAAAASAGPKLLESLNVQTGKYYTAVQGNARAIGLATGDKYVEGQVAGEEQKAADLKERQQIALTGTLTDVSTQLLGIANATGSGIPTNMAARIVDSRQKVIDSLSSSLTVPQQTAVRTMEQIASLGGTGVATGLANAIANGTPLVVTKQQALKDGINAQTALILKQIGITVTVDDKASGVLAQITSEGQGLLKAFNAGTVGTSYAGLFGDVGTPKTKADGGPIKGQGGPRSDVLPILASDGEFMINAYSASKHLGLLHAINADKYADGGLIGANITETVNVENQLAQLQNKVGQLSGAGGATPSGPAVARWTADVLSVLAMLHQPASFLPNVLRQIQTESGGDPSAVDNWDSNAAIGQNSRGLMQTIPSTFAAYAGPYEGLGIYNGLASIYAGVNYALHRYGSLSILGQGHGYANGGVVGGSGTGDTQPILATPGEGVVSLAGMAKLGAGGLAWLNSGKQSGDGQHYADGGIVISASEGRSQAAAAASEQRKEISSYLSSIAKESKARSAGETTAQKAVHSYLAAIAKSDALIAAYGVKAVENTTTAGIKAGSAAIAAGVKEGNGPLSAYIEDLVKAAQGNLYATSAAAVANGSVSPAEYAAVQARAAQVASLTATLTKLNTVNTSLLDSLKTFTSTQQQFRDSLVTSISQGSGFSDILAESGSPADVRNVLASKLADLKTFTTKIGLLQKKGFSAAIIRDVSSDGITNGILYADELLTSSVADVNAIDSSFAALTAGTTATANQITASTQGGIPGITQQNAQNTINTAIFTTTGANVDLLLGKAEYEQRTDAVQPKAKPIVVHQTNHLNGVDLATAQAQTARSLSLALQRAVS